MAGKRGWYTNRKYLLLAAEHKTAKGANLAGMLYIPEAFSVEKKDEIAQRRAARMVSIAATGAGARKLMLVIGEIKELTLARYPFN
jgi:hypothetical protein